MSETRLLVVEDEANIVEALSYVLQRAGFLVETVSDGDAALQLLKRERFAAVVLDIMIPGMNGFDILRAVRADQACRLADPRPYGPRPGQGPSDGGRNRR